MIWSHPDHPLSAIDLEPKPSSRLQPWIWRGPKMYIAVEGKDRDLSKKDPLRRLFSFIVRTEVQS